MSHESKSRTSVAEPAVEGKAADAAVQAGRRRALLAGGKISAAALAAVAPIRSHAVGGLDVACTLSGQLSAAVSARPGLQTGCEGFMPGHYVAPDPSDPNKKVVVNLPTGFSISASPYFNNVFPTSTDNRLITTILTESGNDDSAWWLAAYFSALQPPPGKPYVYTPSDVIAQYSKTSKPDSADFLDFYRNGGLLSRN